MLTLIPSSLTQIIPLRLFQRSLTRAGSAAFLQSASLWTAKRYSLFLNQHPAVTVSLLSSLLYWSSLVTVLASPRSHCIFQQHRLLQSVPVVRPKVHLMLCQCAQPVTPLSPRLYHLRTLRVSKNRTFLSKTGSPHVVSIPAVRRSRPGLTSFTLLPVVMINPPRRSSVALVAGHIHRLWSTAAGYRVLLKHTYFVSVL